jgi:ADP-heptose:LPS heptosyltransferase
MMHPDRIRRLDYWVGVPLCFILTVATKIAAGLSALIGRRDAARTAAPRNVLLIELAEMGTVVLAWPAISRLLAQHPDARLHFVLFKQIEDSVTVLDIIPRDQVFSLDASSIWTMFRDVVGFIRWTRRHGIDTAINMEPFTRGSMVLTVLSGARTRVGYHPFSQRGLYVGDLTTHKVIYNPHLHTSQSLATLVEAIAAPPDDLPLGKFPAPEIGGVPRLHIDEAARARIREKVSRDHPAAAGKRLILVNPNASSLIPVRRWPLERYAQLVARLVEDPRNACVITGTAGERASARFIVDRVTSDRVIDMTGRTTLKELIELFDTASLLVTNDSGPAHLAAVTDIPVLVFFGPETPNLYRPLSRRCTPLYANFACSPCVSAYNQRLTVCTNNLCLQHFDVDTVHAHVQQLLDSKRGGANL